MKKIWKRCMDFCGSVCYYIVEFVKNWIYPAYYLKNLLFNHYNRVNLPKLKPYHYCDVRERLFYANMELVKFFIEKEEPEKHVVWYGIDGQKYSERCMGTPLMFPEYKNMYIMDLIKKIYNWYSKDFPEWERDNLYLTEVWGRYFYRYQDWIDSFIDNGDGTETMTDTADFEVTYSLEELDKLDLDWNILGKYFTKRDFDNQSPFTNKFFTNFENQIEKEKQHYLHLCVELRSFMWI